jgi:hypothetical protein
LMNTASNVRERKERQDSISVETGQYII